MAETHRKFDRDFKEGAVRLVPDTGNPFAQVALITLHQIVASQLLANNPSEAWHTVQRWPRSATTGTTSCTSSRGWSATTSIEPSPNISRSS
jgi:hypothetical protein